jgi:hypothetical protein
MELRATLSGRDRKPAPAPAAPAAAPAAPRPAPAAPTGAAIASDSLELVAPGGKTLRVRIRTELGKMLMRQFGADSDYWDDRQCVLERSASGQWTVRPAGATTNQTLINGRALTGAHPLKAGDRIAVGNEAKKVAKLPLVVRAA